MYTPRRALIAAAVAAAVLVPAVTAANTITIAFDPQGEVTETATSAPYQLVTAYLLFIPAEVDMNLGGWECTVQIVTTGPPPAINWTLAGQALNIATPPDFIVGLGSPLLYSDAMLLATAEIFVPSPDHEIALHILPSFRPSAAENGYPVQLPDFNNWYDPSELWVASPASGCTERPVCQINSDGVEFPLMVESTGDADFGAVPVGTQDVRTVTLTNACPAAVCGVLSLSGEAYDYRHSDGHWTTLPTWCRINPNQSREIEVRFSPGASGPYYGDLILESCGRLVALPLTGGGGVAPPVSLTPRMLDFGWVRLDEAADRTCTVHNFGDATLDFAPAVAEGPDFSLVGDISAFTLAPGESHDLAARFVPTEVGTQAGRVTFGQPAAPDLLLQGTGLSPSTICLVSFDGNGSGNCGAIAVGYPITRVATIRNTGTEELEGDIELAGDLDAFAILSGGGPVVLPPGGVHAVTFDVDPPAVGHFEATLTTLGGCVDVVLSVDGVLPVLACTVWPESLDFGGVNINTTASEYVYVRNVGTLPFDGEATLPAGPFTVIAGQGPFTLAPGQMRRLHVVFAPTVVDTFAAVLDLGTDACADVPCTGIGLDICAVEPEFLDFGNVATLIPVVWSAVVTNQGLAPLDVNPTLDSPVFSLIEGGGPHVIAPGGQLQLTVRFVAQEPGVYDAVAQLGSTFCADLPVTATAYQGVFACEWVGLESLDFGAHPVGAIATGPLQFRNVGDYTMDDLTFATDSPRFLIDSGAGPVDLPAGATHDIVLWFVPVDTLVYTAELTASIAGCSPLPLRGQGGLPLPMFATVPDSLAFGSVCAGHLWTLDTTVINNEDHALIVYPGVLEGPFSATWDDPEDGALLLAPHASAVVHVTFAPPSLGEFSGQLQFGVLGCTPVPLTGTGISPQPVCSVGAEILDFGMVPIGLFADRALVVSNTGCVELPVAFQVEGTAFAIVGGGGITEIPAESQHTITVRFTPAAQGPASSTLHLGSDLCPEVPLIAEGGGGPLECHAVPAALDLGQVPVGVFRQMSFSVVNDSPHTLQVFLPDRPDTVTFLQGGGTQTIDPGGSLAARARFYGLSLGEFGWILDLGCAACTPLIVTGWGTEGGVCQLYPPSVDFGTVVVGQSAIEYWLVHNAGWNTMTIDPTCEDAAFTWSTTSTDVPADLYVAGWVRFVPTMPGTYDAVLDLGHDACSLLPLHGVAVDGSAPLRVEPAALAFGPVVPGETVTRTCVLINDTPSAVSGTISVSGSGFSLAGGGRGVSLAPGDRHEVVVNYTPPATGEHAGLLSLAGTDLPAVALSGIAFTTDGTSDRVGIFWDPAATATAAASNPFASVELTGYLMLLTASGEGGLVAWEGRIAADGDGEFLDWELAPGMLNLAEPPAFRVMRDGLVEPPAEAVTLATFRYRVPPRGVADFALAAVDAENLAGWPAYRDAADPGKAIPVAPQNAQHVVATVRVADTIEVPGLTRLYPPYPNPFNPQTTFAFDLGEAGRARLGVFDLNGRKVATLVDAVLPVGRHVAVWRGQDDAGRVVPSGTYHARLAAGSAVRTQKLTLLK